MAMILTTAFIAVTALALPNPTESLLPRDDIPPAMGQAQGSPFDFLEFTVYAEKDCKGKPAGIFDGSYGYYAARQMQSYHLNRSLHHGAEVLDFFGGFLPGTKEVNHTVDHARNEHYTLSCSTHDVTAGLDGATTDRPAIRGEHKGCHTLVNNEWCAMIWNTGSPGLQED